MTGTYLTLKNLLRQFVREKKWDEWLNLLPYYSDQCEEEGDWKEMYAARAGFDRYLSAEPIFKTNIDNTQLYNMFIKDKGIAFNRHEFLGNPPLTTRMFYDRKNLYIRCDGEKNFPHDTEPEDFLDTEVHHMGYYACFIPKELGGLL